MRSPPRTDYETIPVSINLLAATLGILWAIWGSREAYQHVPTVPGSLIPACYPNTGSRASFRANIPVEKPASLR
jgi:hypothetical protein